MNNKTKNLIVATYIIIIAFIVITFVSIFKVLDLKETVNKQEQQITELKTSIEDLQVNMEGYIDNYIALWTTLNNAIAGEPEDKYLY